MIDTALRHRALVSLLVVGFILVGSLIDVSPWIGPVYRAEITDALHIPGGLVWMAALGLWIPHHPRALVGAVLVSAGVFALIELSQTAVGRMASMRDVLLSTAGAAYGAALWYARTRGDRAMKRPLSSTALGLIVVATLPIMQKVTAREDVRELWPTLGNFETGVQDALWTPLAGTDVSHAAHGELQTAMGMLDQQYLKLEGATPSVRHAVAVSDWGGFRTLCLEVRGDAAGQLTLRVWDQQADHAGESADVTVPVETHWTRHCTPVAALRTRGGRRLDPAAMQTLEIHAHSGIHRLDIDNVRAYR